MLGLGLVRKAPAQRIKICEYLENVTLRWTDTDSEHTLYQCFIDTDGHMLIQKVT